MAKDEVNFTSNEELNLHNKDRVHPKGANFRGGPQSSHLKHTNKHLKLFENSYQRTSLEKKE
jgi:hypothetical protein